MAHKGHAATKRMRCKQKTVAANKNDALQTKKDRCKQNRCAANKTRTLETKKRTAANKKDWCAVNKIGKPLQTKMETAANKKRTLQRKEISCKQKTTAANKKGNRYKSKTVTGALQTKKETAANIKGSRCRQNPIAANKKAKTAKKKRGSAECWCPLQ